ncbi:MAG: hypothetical protein LBE36_12995 [Flavobacteriaceae bacterium]|jgi:hypothetical protein|nr:hypothetical protein [Flavobacteriaceae bacterium]
MNPRILELLKSPKTISANDLDLLNSEIKKTPYVQNIRVLHLYGIHKFFPENYAEELSKTAAYTTDKKILYRFINGDVRDSSSEVRGLSSEVRDTSFKMQGSSSKMRDEDFEIRDNETEIKTDEIINEKETENIENEVELKETETETEEIINEKENIHENSPQFPPLGDRGLETEETINENSEEIIPEIQETENIHSDYLPHFPPSEDRGLETEEIINEKETDTDTSTSLSVTSREQEANGRQPTEMQKLIAETEAKMKLGKKTEIEEEENEQNHEINFAETQDFSEIKRHETEEITDFVQPDNEQPTSEIESEKIINEKENILEDSPHFGHWKPMSVETQTPDSLLEKKSPVLKTAPIAETKIEEKKDLDSAQSDKAKEKIEEKKKSEEKKEDFDFAQPDKAEEKVEAKPISQSNVSQFVSTWKTWLKIDRSENFKPEILPIAEIKTKAIDKFIETEPKISQLKEDADYVVKEKSEDISHLMTETLAQLYVEQKLYSKAINAYKTLKEKYPKKAKKFDKKIAEIKELRSGK